MTPPVAVIDIGTNTTRLLVAERSGVGLRKLLSQRAFTRIGRGVLPDGSISAEKLDELTHVVALQAKLADVLGADSPQAFATAAVREATNRDHVIESIKRCCNVEVEILDGDEEARLAFAGATHAIPVEPSATIAVVDVGGGSTEIAIGTLAGGVTWSRSIPVGSASSDQLTLPPSEALPQVEQAIAIGGCASSLRKLVGNTLDHETLERANRLIGEFPAEIVAEEFGLDLERVEVLPAGARILETVSDWLKLPLRIGKGGVREGKLLELVP